MRLIVFFFKQKTAYEMRISDWSSDVCSSDLAAFAPGIVAVAALTLTSFFMSIMFPTIFSLGVKDLGDRAMLGAPLIIMAIIGGALFPPLMGLASQAIGGVIQHTMLLPGLCFAVIALSARRTPRAERLGHAAAPPPPCARTSAV